MDDHIWGSVTWINTLFPSHFGILYVIMWPSDSLTILWIHFQAVNELLESLGAPLEIVEGFVNSITVTIPWAALVTEHCTLEVTGLQITCRPKYRTSELYWPFFVDSFLFGSHMLYTTELQLFNCLFSVRRKLGFPRMVVMHDVQHAAGPGVPEGPTRGVRRAACSPGGAGNVCTDHRDRCVSAVASNTFAYWLMK